MLRIRLMRMGRRHRPQYRVIVTDSRRPRESRYKEAIGFYDPVPNPSVCRLDLERYEYWVSRGAQPSSAVRKIVKIVRRHSSSSGASTEEKVQE